MAIYYRGDNRHPTAGDQSIFKYGFERRGAGKLSTRLQDGFRPAIGDMDPNAAVCMTTRLDVAPIFPVSNNNPRWIYAIFVDEAFVKNPDRYSMYADTHAWQAGNGINWPKYAWEEAIGAIDPPDIIAAVKVKITRINCTSYEAGTGPFKAQFQAIDQVMINTYCSSTNPSCTVANDVRTTVVQDMTAWHAQYSGSFCGMTPDPTDTPDRP